MSMLLVNEPQNLNTKTRRTRRETAKNAKAAKKEIKHKDTKNTKRRSQKSDCRMQSGEGRKAEDCFGLCPRNDMGGAPQ